MKGFQFLGIMLLALVFAFGCAKKQPQTWQPVTPTGVQAGGAPQANTIQPAPSNYRTNYVK